MLLSNWYDLSDVKLAEALDDRGSFRRFCGFSASEPTPERTACVFARPLWHRVWTSLCSTRSPASSRPRRSR
ncbi:transposase [Bradyrhizobium sp. Arg314]